MRHRIDILVLILSIVVLSCSHEIIDKSREKKAFSLFSIVTFKNDQCTTQTAPSVTGVCMTSTECATVGAADGNCAASFGVCCLIRVSTCGSSVTQNCSYVENPGYTATSTFTPTASSTCIYTVSGSTSICNIRLDFTDVVLQQPATTGICTNTILSINSGTTATTAMTNPPNTCGTLTGQHMYVETGRSTTAATLTMTYGAAGAAANRYRIKVSTIGCSNVNRPPQGCLQYFYGSHRHTITSMNWDGTNAHATGGLLQVQAYTVCIRPEKGVCGTTFQASPVASSLLNFEIEENGAVAEAGGANCANMWVQIHLKQNTAGTTGRPGKTANDYLCGGVLSESDGATAIAAGASIHASRSNAFQMGVYVDTGVTTISMAGFSIDAQAQSCTS